MNNPSQSCPKCQGEMTELKGGLTCCPRCGFQGEPPKSNDFTAETRSKKAFWILLLAPAALSLTSFLVGRFSREVGVGIGIAGLIVGAIASIYCGCWMAIRFFEQTGSRTLAGLLLIPAIALVNFLVVCAGCAANVSLR